MLAALATPRRVRRNRPRWRKRASASWYEPYGEVSATGSSNNPYQYTGRENDGTGLYYYRARYYSPSLKRFISEDPKGLSAGLNEYAYIKGSPTNGNDPFGLESPTFSQFPMPVHPVECNIQLGLNGTVVSELGLQVEYGFNFGSGNACVYRKICVSPPGGNIGQFAGAGPVLSAGSGPVSDSPTVTFMTSAQGGAVGEAGGGAEFSSDGASFGRGTGGYGRGAYFGNFICATEPIICRKPPPPPDSCDCGK
jgi:RHS repeat-associated protein